MKNFAQIFLWLGTVTTLAAAPAPTDFPPVAPRTDTAQLGAALQRSMGLMASSTPQDRNTVRVLFYGQSITEQAWWKIVADDLRRRFPDAHFVIENRAIGGHAAQLLVKTAEADLYPFQPDLLIFHVYGSHIDYESIIQRVRERTTADILMTTDHVTKDDQLDEETDASKLTSAKWDAFMNHKFLPQTAAKYDAELGDLRTGWKNYLRDNKLSAAELLKDGVHLNKHGEFVMAELVKPYLRYDPQLSARARNDTVRTFVVGRDLAGRDGRLVFDFEGRRVDAILAPGVAVRGAVRIDGRKPSELPETYRFTRVSAFPQSNWPVLLKVGSGAPLLVEDWTLTLDDVSADGKQAKFSLAGSKTGADGNGISGEKFVSKSRRVVIEPGEWNLEFCYKVFKRALPPGHKATWKVIAFSADELKPPPAGPSGTELTVTLAQGLENARHHLEITGGGEAGLRAIRVYRPLLGRKR